MIEWVVPNTRRPLGAGHRVQVSQSLEMNSRGLTGPGIAVLTWGPSRVEMNRTRPPWFPRMSSIPKAKSEEALGPNHQ